MPAYPIELSVDYYFCKRTSNGCHSCLKWTFNYYFWIRVTAHPEEKPNISKQLDITEQHPLFASLAEALNNYEDFPEPHLNSCQLHILGGLIDSLL